MKKRIFILALIAIFSGFGARASELSGREIMQRVKDRPDGETRYATIEMTLVQKSGHQRVRKLESWSMDIGKDSKRIMFFTYPGDVKGTGFLTWDYDDVSKADDKWLYLPAMKKTRRISGKSSKTDYFMGSDFTYDDMSTRSVDEEKHELLREEMLGEYKCWVVNSVPSNKDEIYSRRVTWIRQDCFMVVRAEYYDKLDKLHRLLTVSQIEKIQGFWTMHLMQMENVQTGHKTIIRMDDQKYDLNISQNLFTVSKLEKGL